MNRFVQKNLIVSLAIIALTIASQALAQTAPTMHISWRTNNFAPAEYRGAILPTAKTIIVVGIDVIDNGAVVNLSKTQINWLINGKTQQSAVGKQRLSFIAPPSGNGAITVKAVIPNYNGGSIEKTIYIPIATPEVVIKAPYPNKKVPAEGITLGVSAFFFNVVDTADLQFSWSANNNTLQGQEGSANTVAIRTENAKPKDTILVSANALNSTNPSEFANNTLIFEVQ